KLLQCDQQGVAHLEVQMVRRLIEQQQVGFACYQDRQCQAGPLSAGEPPRRLEHPLTAESKATEVVASLLFCPGGNLGAATSSELGQRRVIRVEVLELDLREEAGHDIRRHRERSSEGGELSG